jgi:hypothetical protein
MALDVGAEADAFAQSVVSIQFPRLFSMAFLSLRPCAILMTQWK